MAGGGEKYKGSCGKDWGPGFHAPEFLRRENRGSNVSGDYRWQPGPLVVADQSSKTCKISNKPSKEILQILKLIQKP